MGSIRERFFSIDSRVRLLLTLALAVLLPAGALVSVNFHHLKEIKRDQVLDAAIHRDFQYTLAIAEKDINKKVYSMVQEARNAFPSPDSDSEPERARKLELLLSKSPWISHAFLFDAEKGFLFRPQPQQLTDRALREETARNAEMYRGWFGLDGASLLEQARAKSPPVIFNSMPGKRAGRYCHMMSAFFPLGPLARDRIVLAGVVFDPTYLEDTFFPQMLQELITRKVTEGPIDLVVYPTDHEGGHLDQKIAASPGWGKGKPEVFRNMDDVFRGLALGIKLQGTTVAALSQSWVRRSFLILGVLSLLMIGGLVLTYRSVSKEIALARLKSDFVSNVSHELRTPLALIRLYAETLELGRITTQEKKEDYYRIIRKESERLTALINNILDFSRIEAGRKEYDFRETDIADLVRNTLDSYRYQIEQQGFALEQSIDADVPPVRVDREAIARALVNLINNALKYSASEKFLGINLYRESGLVKLEVVDRGIGITRRDQSKIFEKFYRTGDPLVHTTKGSGLGLSLVRHITQAHGGDVHVESMPGKGSKFTLLLPITSPAH